MTNERQIMSSWSWGQKLIMKEGDRQYEQTALFELPDLECRECHYPLGKPWHSPRTGNCFFGEGPRWQRRLRSFRHWVAKSTPFLP